MSKAPADYECHEYSIPVAGRILRLWGPKYPHALNNDPTVQKRFEMDGYKPYWALPSPAAVMLAEHVIERVQPSPDPVLEIGAGLGIVGLALSMSGHRVVMTDYDRDALSFIQASASINDIQLHAVQLLDWRHLPSDHYRVIVGSEIAYEKRSHQSLAALLSSCLKPDGTAFVSDLNRSATDVFPTALQNEGLTVDSVPSRARAIPAFDSIDGRILKGRIFCITH